ncbi:hypothetical protein [Nocardia sp. NPDC058497]|uniref:hypothetical protein n=1 Tax=Nocardia sp. NPDC058497 TaxID=3346529 RepID=UPI00364F7574
MPEPVSGGVGLGHPLMAQSVQVAPLLPRHLINTVGPAAFDVVGAREEFHLRGWDVGERGDFQEEMSHREISAQFGLGAGGGIGVVIGMT